MRATLNSLLVGWLSLLASFGIWLFLPIHGPGFAPEIGPFGVFIIFGAIMSGLYAIDHLLFNVAYHISGRRVDAPWIVGLIEALLLVASIPLWLLLFGTQNLASNSLYFSPFALVAGFTAGCYMVRTQRKEEAKPGAPPNGCPATPVRNSGVTQGPPSLS